MKSVQPALYIFAPLPSLPTLVAQLTISSEAEQLGAKQSNKNWSQKFVFDMISPSIFQPVLETVKSRLSDCSSHN